jgi:hypothetical protein
LPKAFYIGVESDTPTEVNLSSDGLDPNTVLSLLGVCKRWYFIGVHCFYGLNKFAFSESRSVMHQAPKLTICFQGSIGEFGRFMKGIGKRASRIQFLE